jgi:hypothetical protein
MNDAEKQRAYEAKRPKLAEAYPTIEYRVWLKDREPFVTRAIGPSQLCAHYSDMIAFCVVGAEPKKGMMGEFY